MIAKRIAGATHNLGAPKGMEGEVRPLWVKAARDPDLGSLVVFESAWEPTPRELELLNAGHSVVLRVVGGMPPVALYVAGEVT
jgi:hypothetical protein